MNKKVKLDPSGADPRATDGRNGFYGSSVFRDTRPQIKKEDLLNASRSGLLTSGRKRPYDATIDDWVIKQEADRLPLPKKHYYNDGAVSNWTYTWRFRSDGWGWDRVCEGPFTPQCSMPAAEPDRESILGWIKSKSGVWHRVRYTRPKGWVPKEESPLSTQTTTMASECDASDPTWSQLESLPTDTQISRELDSSQEAALNQQAQVPNPWSQVEIDWSQLVEMLSKDGVDQSHTVSLCRSPSTGKRSPVMNAEERNTSQHKPGSQSPELEDWNEDKDQQSRPQTSGSETTSYSGSTCVCEAAAAGAFDKFDEKSVSAATKSQPTHLWRATHRKCPGECRSNILTSQDPSQRREAPRSLSQLPKTVAGPKAPDLARRHRSPPPYEDPQKKLLHRVFPQLSSKNIGIARLFQGEGGRRRRTRNRRKHTRTANQAKQDTEDAAATDKADVSVSNVRSPVVPGIRETEDAGAACSTATSVQKAQSTTKRTHRKAEDVRDVSRAKVCHSAPVEHKAEDTGIIRSDGVSVQEGAAGAASEDERSKKKKKKSKKRRRKHNREEHL